MAEYGVSFAPTRDNAMQGPRNAQLTGVPEAVQTLSLRLPRVLGARPITPPDLLTSQGGHGIDPIASAVLETILKTMGRPLPGQPGSLPGGTAGPNPSPFPGGEPPRPGDREGKPPAPFTMPQDAPAPSAPPPWNPKPRVIPQDDPTAPEPGSGGGPGGWVPGNGPYVPPRRGRMPV